MAQKNYDIDIDQGEKFGLYFQFTDDGNNLIDLNDYKKAEMNVRRFAGADDMLVCGCTYTYIDPSPAPRLHVCMHAYTPADVWTFRPHICLLVCCMQVRSFEFADYASGSIIFEWNIQYSTDLGHGSMEQCQDCAWHSQGVIRTSSQMIACRSLHARTNTCVRTSVSK